MVEVRSGEAGRFGPWIEVIASTQQDGKHLGVAVEERGVATLEVQIGIGNPGAENVIASIDISPTEPHHVRDPFSLTPHVTVPSGSRVVARLRADRGHETARVAVNLI